MAQKFCSEFVIPHSSDEAVPDELLLGVVHRAVLAAASMILAPCLEFGDGFMGLLLASIQECHPFRRGQYPALSSVEAQVSAIPMDSPSTGRGHRLLCRRFPSSEQLLF